MAPSKMTRRQVPLLSLISELVKESSKKESLTLMRNFKVNANALKVPSKKATSKDSSMRVNLRKTCFTDLGNLLTAILAIYMKVSSISTIKTGLAHSRSTPVDKCTLGILSSTLRV
jgi:hypothetical protein